MAFSRPTRATIQARVAADIERVTGQTATSRGDIYYPLAQAIAGVSHGMHGHLQYNAAQLFDDTADDENLLRRAAEMGILRIQPTRASGTATATGNNGALIEAGTLLQDANEVKYRVTATATIENQTAALSITAIDAGEAGNQDVGAKLTFVSTVLDVDADAVVIDLSGGTDIETIERVRLRLSERRKSPPMGGNKADYVNWALAAGSYVTRAWCYPNEMGLGTVTVRFVTEDLSSVVATQTQIDEVTEYIDERRPVAVKGLYVLPVIERPLNLVFTQLSPNTTAVHAAIEAELNDLIKREVVPGGTLKISKIREAISLATGEDDYEITLDTNAASGTGEFITLGVTTWP